AWGPTVDGGDCHEPYPWCGSSVIGLDIPTFQHCQGVSNHLATLDGHLASGNSNIAGSQTLGNLAWQSWLRKFQRLNQFGNLAWPFLDRVPVRPSRRPGLHLGDRKPLGPQGTFHVLGVERTLIFEVKSQLAFIDVGLNARLLYPRQSPECFTHSVGSA